MRYYYLKIGPGNSLAKQWLNGNNPLKRPAAVIFFRQLKLEEIRNDQGDSQARNFYESSLPEFRAKTIMVVISGGTAWFLKPADRLIEHNDPTDNENLWKIMPVEVISAEKLADVPLVLASINVNAYLSRGTYRKITNWGNIKAIHYSLDWPLPNEHLAADAFTSIRLLECLSSIEQETLVAKVFEAAGCFVPAYRGGQVKDVDLFVYNDGETEKQLDGLSVPPKSGKAIQVKGYTKLKKCPESVDYLIGLGIANSSNTFNENWLLNQVKAFPTVRNWLIRSLHWLPNDFISQCGL